MPVSLFLKWYEIPRFFFGDEITSVRGWDIFESTDAVMVLSAMATIFLVVKAKTMAGAWISIVGAVATVAVVVELLNKPTLFALPGIPGMTIQIGAWLGLLGALLVLAAGGLGLLAESRTT